MKVIGDNIRKRREQLGMSQEELAKAVGKKQQSIQQIESGTVQQPRYLNKLLKALDVSYEQLLSGKFDSVRSPTARYSPANDGSVEYWKQVGSESGPASLVPLISWIQAGEWCEAADPFQPGDAEDWLPCPVKHSPSTYILRVRGDSMTSPYGKSYPDGMLIFVDPEQRGGVEPGERVIAKINGENMVTFKQLAQDNGKMFLKPLNPQYPSIHEPFRILGKIIFAGWEE